MGATIFASYSFYLCGFIINIISCLALLYVIFSINSMDNSFKLHSGAKRFLRKLFCMAIGKERKSEPNREQENLKRESNPMIYSLIKHLCIGNLILQIAYFQYYIIGVFYWAPYSTADKDDDEMIDATDDNGFPLDSTSLFGFCNYTIFLKVWGRNIASMWAFVITIIIYLILLIPHKFREKTDSQKAMYFRRTGVVCYTLPLILALWEVILVKTESITPLEYGTYVCDYFLESDGMTVHHLQLYISLVYLLIPGLLSAISVCMLIIVYYRVIKRRFRSKSRKKSEWSITIRKFFQNNFSFKETENTAVLDKHLLEIKPNASHKSDSSEKGMEIKKNRSRITRSIIILSIFPIFNMVVSIFAFVADAFAPNATFFTLFTYFLEDLTGVVCFLIYLIRVRNDKLQNTSKPGSCWNRIFVNTEIESKATMNSLNISSLNAISRDSVQEMIDSGESIFAEDEVDDMSSCDSRSRGSTFSSNESMDEV